MTEDRSLRDLDVVATVQAFAEFIADKVEPVPHWELSLCEDGADCVVELEGNGYARQRASVRHQRRISSNSARVVFSCSGKDWGVVPYLGVTLNGRMALAVSIEPHYVRAGDALIFDVGSIRYEIPKSAPVKLTAHARLAPGKGEG